MPDSSQRLPRKEEERAIRLKYGLSDGCNDHAMLYRSLEHIVRSLLDDMIGGSGSCIGNEHPWIHPLLLTIEVLFVHKLRDMKILWEGAIKEANQQEAAVCNALRFTLLNTPIARLRAWIGLSLMNRSLAQQLEAIDHDRLDSCYHSGAFLPAYLGKVISLIASLESLEFALYIKESEIGVKPLVIDWQQLLASPDNIIDYRVLGVRLPVATPSTIDADRLRAALRSQINQRSFYQEECKRLQARVAEVEDELRSRRPEADAASAAGLRIRVLEERLKVSELVREELWRKLMEKCTPFNGEEGRSP